jgi:PEP-CTERM motif
VTVQPLTQYFLYEDTLIPAGAITGGNFLPGEDSFFTPNQNLPFAGDGLSANFALTGTVAVSAVPEPAALASLGMGIMTLAGYGWRRAKAAAA